MKFSASHCFERPLDEVAAMFLDPDGHVGRYALMGDRDIEIRHAETGDGTLDLETVRTVEEEVPAVARRIIKSTNTITTTDRWQHVAGVLTGRSKIEASNVPGTATIVATIEPDGESACRYAIDLTLDMRVPLIGRRFAGLLRPQVMEIVNAEFEAWDRWFASVDVT